jgi:DNA-binding transcriptional MerR regulator
MNLNSDKHYTTKDLAEMLGIEAVTVRKYALALEKAGYIVDRSDSDRRAYSEKDAMVFQQLKALRDRNAFNVETAAMVVASKHIKASESVSLSPSEKNSPDVMQYDERYILLMQKLDQVLSIQNELATAAEEQKREVRQNRVTDLITDRRIQTQLRKEARKLWDEKPEEERFKRVGLFRKDEDTSKRDRFIEEYVDEHIVARLQSEYGLSE